MSAFSLDTTPLRFTPMPDVTPMPTYHARATEDIQIGDVLFAGHFLGEELTVSQSGVLVRGTWVKVTALPGEDRVRPYSHLVEPWPMRAGCVPFFETFFGFTPWRPAVSLVKPTPTIHGRFAVCTCGRLNVRSIFRCVCRRRTWI